MHSSIINDQDLLQSMPIIGTKKNEFSYNIVLYGEENKISQEKRKEITKAKRLLLQSDYLVLELIDTKYMISSKQNLGNEKKLTK